MAEALPENSDSDFSDDQSPLDEAFNVATTRVAMLTSKLDNNQLLELYGLYKQSTHGQCDIPKPGWLDGKGRKKWEAWKNLGDMASDNAKQKYIDLVKKYDPEFDLISSPSAPSKNWVIVSSLQYSPEPDLNENDLTLLDASRENMADLVTKLLIKNPELRNLIDEDGLTALHWAADRDATSALTAAIQGGCNLDAVDNSRQTALHYAVSCGHVESTKILLEAGASILKDDEGNTPLDLASDEEVRKVLECASR